MKYRYLLLIIVVFLFSTASFANHIVGGTLTYERTGGGNYKIILTLYRDCNTIPTPNTPFPSYVFVTILRADGSLHSTHNILKGANSFVPQNIDTCVSKSAICLQMTTYTKTVTLLPNTNGYYIFEQGQCCRNPSLLTIFNPIKSGDTFFTQVPDPGSYPNSSPKWINPMPDFVCQGKNMNVAFGATEVDGDSLHYSLYTPYDSNKITFPGGVFTPTLVTWTSTYSANNPLNPNILNSLQINNKGLITGIPPTIGLFLVGVRCEEFRNKKKIGEILSDFQLSVISCPPIPVASFDIVGACNGTQVSFTNTTSPTSNLNYWDFGNISTLADTSHLKTPSYNYPSLDSYTVTLITNKGNSCADTAIKIVKMPALKAKFTHVSAVCEDSVVKFTDQSTLTSGITIDSWKWDFGNGKTATTQHPTTTYSAGNTYNVKLVVSAAGCIDSILSTITIQKKPLANAGNDTMRCANNAVLNLDGKIEFTNSAKWVASGSFSPNNSTLNATYTPTPSAVNKGLDSLLLITTANGLCTADTDLVVISFYKGPTVNVGSNRVVCKNVDSIHLCALVTLATGVNWYSKGTGTFVNSTPLCSSYLPSIADKNANNLTLYATTTGNGNCTAVNDSLLITFDSAPSASITSPNYACENQSVPTAVNVSTNTGFWTTSGTGNFYPNTTALNGVYQPSAADIAAKSVILTFISTNNLSCNAAVDTNKITFLVPPKAAFTSGSLCINRLVSFNDNSVSNDKITTWKWDFGDGTNSTLKNSTHTYNSLGPYNVKLIVTSKNTCSDTLTKTILLTKNPTADFISVGGCLSDSAKYTDASKIEEGIILKWQWLFDDGATSTLKNPLHKYTISGNHVTMLKVTSSKGCVDSTTKSLMILDELVANFHADTKIAYINQAINFIDNSKGATTWYWDFGNSSGYSNLQNPLYNYPQVGVFNVCLVASNSVGCIDTTCQTEIITMQPGVPSGFTPNNDGQNDQLFVYGGIFNKFIFKLYNNWGQLIFESTNQSIGWDGKYKGIDQPIGSYIYTLYCESEDGKEHQLSGDVTLIR